MHDNYIIAAPKITVVSLDLLCVHLAWLCYKLDTEMSISSKGKWKSRKNGGV